MAQNKTKEITGAVQFDATLSRTKRERENVYKLNGSDGKK